MAAGGTAVGLKRIAVRYLNEPAVGTGHARGAAGAVPTPGVAVPLRVTQTPAAARVIDAAGGPLTPASAGVVLLWPAAVPAQPARAAAAAAWGR